MRGTAAHFLAEPKEGPDWLLADKRGFEPLIRYERIHAFQACAFNHSATCPARRALSARTKVRYFSRSPASCNPARGAAVTAPTMRSTYRAIMSTSRFTDVPTCKWRNVVT